MGVEHELKTHDHPPCPIKNMPFVCSTGAAAANITILDGDLDNLEYRGFILETQIAGESLSFGDLVYHSSDNRWYKTDADTLSKTEGDLAIVVTTGTININDYITILKHGTVRYDSWSGTTGEIIYISQTVGAMTTTEPSESGTFSRKVGYLQASNIVYFAPDGTVLENA